MIAGPGLKAVDGRLAAAFIGEIQGPVGVAALEEVFERARLADFGQAGAVALLGCLDGDRRSRSSFTRSTMVRGW